MITVALYSVNAPGANYIDKLISWYCNSEYVHVELILSDGYMYSSSGRDKGVRRKKHIRDDKSWTYIEVDGDEQAILDFYHMTLHDSYDMKGVIGIVLPIIDRTNEWFCSEWCSNALKISGNKDFWLVDPQKTRPSDFYDIVK